MLSSGTLCNADTSETIFRRWTKIVYQLRIKSFKTPRTVYTSRKFILFKKLFSLLKVIGTIEVSRILFYHSWKQQKPRIWWSCMPTWRSKLPEDCFTKTWTIRIPTGDGVCNVSVLVMTNCSWKRLPRIVHSSMLWWRTNRRCVECSHFVTENSRGYSRQHQGFQLLLGRWK